MNKESEDSANIMRDNKLEIAGISVFTNKPVKLSISSGRIINIEDIKDTYQKQDKLPYLAPGLVDLQINGYSGVDFNTLPLSSDQVVKATREILRKGVTTFFPTVITNSDSSIEKLVSIINEARHKDQLTADAIQGIHLEGPFISRDVGARGAHDIQYIREPDWDSFVRWQKASGDLIKIITISPEWDNSNEFIEKCRSNGVTVSIGHTIAKKEKIDQAVLWGAAMSTHLGNGAPAMIPRHPNFIWEQLAADELHTCMIADGFHLPDSVIQVFMRAKRDKIMLVSDAVYLSGEKPGNYHTHIGGDVTLTDNGKLYLTNTPKLLAGSVQMLPDAIGNLIRKNLTTLKEAWEMGSKRPGEFMGMHNIVDLMIGSWADIVTFNRIDDRIEFIDVYKHGRKVN